MVCNKIWRYWAPLLVSALMLVELLHAVGIRRCMKTVVLWMSMKDRERRRMTKSCKSPGEGEKGCIHAVHIMSIAHLKDSDPIHKGLINEHVESCTKDIAYDRLSRMSDRTWELYAWTGTMRTGITSFALTARKQLMMNCVKFISTKSTQRYWWKMGDYSNSYETKLKLLQLSLRGWGWLYSFLIFVLARFSLKALSIYKEKSVQRTEKGPSL